MGVIARGRAGLHALWDGGRGWVLVFVALGWFLLLGTRFLFPALFPYLRRAFALDLAALGTLYTLLWAIYGLSQFPSGIVGDRIGDRRTLAYSAALSAGAIAVVASAITPWMLAGGMLLFGVTSALYGPARFTLLNRVYPDYDGTALGVNEAAGQAGNAALPALGGLLASVFAWQAGLLFLVPLFAIAAGGLWFVPLDDERRGPTENGTASFAAIRRIVRGVWVPRTLVLTAILAIMMFVIQGSTGFYPTYLIDVKGVSPETASLMFGFMFAIGAIMQPIAGVMSDTFGPRRTLLALFGTAAAGLALVTAVTARLPLVAVTVLLSTAPGGIPVLYSQLTDVIPSEIEGSGLGLLRSGVFLFASTSSFVVGQMADRDLFDEAFVLLALFAATALGVTLLLGRAAAPATR